MYASHRFLTFFSFVSFRRYGGLQLSRFPQIMLNFRSKSTGQLSMVSYVLNVIGSVS